MFQPSIGLSRTVSEINGDFRTAISVENRQFFLPHVYLTPPSSAAIPDVEIRPETETRPEPDIDNPAEIQVSMSAICEEGCSSRHIRSRRQQFICYRPESPLA